MKLYIKAGACSLASHIVLCETGFDFTTESVDLATKITETGTNFYDINPKGQVPTLILDDGSVLTEGVAIMQYLADRVPAQNLIPETGTLEYYQAIAWINYIATELHKGFAPLFYPDTPDSYKEITKQKLHVKFGYLNDLLSKQNYILGDAFSIADAYLYVVLMWTKFLSLDMSNYPSLLKYLTLLGNRNSVKQARVEEGLPEVM